MYVGKVGNESDGYEYFCNNVGSGKYYPGGPSCTKKVKKLSALSIFLKVGEYQGIFSQTYLGT